MTVVMVCLLSPYTSPEVTINNDNLRKGGREGRGRNEGRGGRGRKGGEGGSVKKWRKREEGEEEEEARMKSVGGN